MHPDPDLSKRIRHDFVQNTREKPHMILNLLVLEVALNTDSKLCTEHRWTKTQSSSYEDH